MWIFLPRIFVAEIFVARTRRCRPEALGPRWMAGESVVTLTVDQAAAQRNAYCRHISHKRGKPSAVRTVSPETRGGPPQTVRARTVCYARNEYLLQARHALRAARWVDKLGATGLRPPSNRRMFNRMNGVRHV
ncbi:hypothetical protein FH063_003666 [Azospirillum argentinense]|uniref:Uncharacterized protein n=1 Tax=Azospirillum argentinense TaxID=2970906 RepID=A0A5B0KYF1_9PROT|nr:hypothetical protein FH063_003666 [Azospirillum argentinense]